MPFDAFWFISMLFSRQVRWWYLLRKIARWDLRCWLCYRRRPRRMPRQDHHFPHWCSRRSVRLEPSENLQVPDQIGAQIEARPWMYHHSPRSLQLEILISSRSGKTIEDQMVFGSYTCCSWWNLWRVRSPWSSFGSFSQPSWCCCFACLWSSCPDQLWRSSIPRKLLKTVISIYLLKTPPRFVNFR